MNDFYAREFWRFVVVQQNGGKLGTDGDRVSADAGAGLLQPRSGQGPGRGDDEAARAVITSPWRSHSNLALAAFAATELTLCLHVGPLAHFRHSLWRSD